MRRTWLPLLLLAGCAARPDGPAARALYDDLRAVVVTRQRVDWVADRHELEDAAPDVLRSVCQTPPAERRALAAWLDGRIAAGGGPAAARFERNGGDLGDVAALLTLERVRAALAYGERHAAADCPFWLRPDPAFAGVQSDARRFVLLLETMGGPQLVLRDGDPSVGGFGVARLLPAWGVGERLTLALGVEAGAASTFPRGEAGRQVRPVGVAGVPLLARVREETWRFDFEVAGTLRASRGELEAPRPGGRATVAVLLAALRIAGAMPYGGLWMGYEHQPAWKGNAALDVFLVGTRFGLDWDP